MKAITSTVALVSFSLTATLSWDSYTLCIRWACSDSTLVYNVGHLNSISFPDREGLRRVGEDWRYSALNDLSTAFCSPLSFSYV
jgi:hypothetical protein